MTKFRMPTAYTILIIIVILMAAMTWIIPPGQYEYFEPDSGTSEPLPGSYHQTAPEYQGVGDVILAPFKGFYNSVDVCVFILMVGGFLGVIMKTGAIEQSVEIIISALKGRERIMIPVLMILFGLGGTSYGMWEETMAFYPLLIPVFIMAGFDAISAIAVIVLGAGIGTLCSTVNPFATGIASGFASISVGDGIVLRAIMFIILESMAIVFVMRYASKIQKNPQLSVTCDINTQISNHFFRHKDMSKITGKLSGRQKTVLFIFLTTFIIMIYSVIPFDEFGIDSIPTIGWWFPELSGLFLVSGIMAGLFARLSEEELTRSFIAGSSDLLGVAFIIGISRGITEIMNDGRITDTILHWGESALTGTGPIAFIWLIYLIYIPLSFFIPSTSGLAALSIPILAPLGKFADVPASLIVTSFQSASGLVNLITPTSAVIMGALAVGRVPYEKWLKFVWKFLILIFVVSFIILTISTTLK